MLSYYYGKDITDRAMENRDDCVSKRVTNKLTIKQPSAVLVDQYLVEICKAYGIDWSPKSVEDDDNDGGGIEASIGYESM